MWAKRPEGRSSAYIDILKDPKASKLIAFFVDMIMNDSRSYMNIKIGEKNRKRIEEIYRLSPGWYESLIKQIAVCA
jgi:hypothetical protein